MTKRSIFILSGQSNMSGRGGVKDRRWDGAVPAACLPHPSILRLSASGEWEPAGEPLHFDIDIPKPCGIGPGIPFARALLPVLSSTADAEIGLVPCAEGGTAIAEWARGSRLYSQMLRRAKEAVAAGVGGEIKAVIWFQGESDTLDEEAAEVYGSRMERLIGDLRSDLGLSALPFIQLQEKMQSSYSSVGSDSQPPTIIYRCGMNCAVLTCRQGKNNVEDFIGVADPRLRMIVTISVGWMMHIYQQLTTNIKLLQLKRGLQGN